MHGIVMPSNLTAVAEVFFFCENGGCRVTAWAGGDATCDRCPGCSGTGKVWESGNLLDRVLSCRESDPEETDGT